MEDDFLLILDDYHHVSDPSVHRFLSEFLRYPPHNLNLVITSRMDPPLPLAALRAHDQLTEVRTAHLRFTREETAAYLNSELDQVLDAITLTLLDNSTEGWIAGLRLAVLYLRNTADIATAARQFAQGNRFALDYLATEVLAKQDADVQTFLIRTSILTRLCPDLCDAILGVDPSLQHSRRILKLLTRADVFLSSLDGQDQWFRYHQLFQHFLEHQLRATHSPVEIAALYAVACRWCTAHALIDEAISYALASGNLDTAVSVIEAQRQAAMNSEQWRELERWLNLFPRHVLNSTPQLIILEAWTLHKRERLLEIPERLDLAEELLATGNLAEDVKAHLQSEIDTLRSQQIFWSGDAALCCITARRALARAPLEKANVRGIAWLFATGGVFLSEGRHAALASLLAAAAEDPMRRTLVTARSLTARCFVCWMAADMPRLKQAGEELLYLARNHDWQESQVWGHYFCGCANYEQNNLEQAAADFTAMRSWRHNAPGFAFMQGSFGLAAVLQAQGRKEEANAVTESLLGYTHEIGDGANRLRVQAFRAHLALGQKRYKEALHWLSGADRIFHSTPIPTFYAPILTVAATLIHSNTSASLDEADQLLRDLERLLSDTHNARFRVEVWLLQAHLCTLRKQEEQAVALLESAIALARPGNLLRTFLDADSALDKPFAALNLGGENGAFLRQLLQGRRANEEKPSLAAYAPTPSPPPLAQPRHPDLIELLTNREMEVLQLLAIRLTNKEIADALNISTSTVKQHTMSVFRKLHVENRREAIVQALAMGFRLNTRQ